MFDDRVRVLVKAGNGGNGKVSFHTAKNVRTGAPDGGDGGRGGDIIVVADKNKTTLSDFRFEKTFRAGNGLTGGNNTCTGKSGDSITLKVPCGTIIKDEETGKTIADLFYDGDQIVLLKGGMGGKGNARFKSSRRQSPTFSQTGQKTDEHYVIFELKTIADVGLVGFPNVGKSTLLSVMTEARPKIANYHFTTLAPNLGVAKAYDKSFVIADIPGLIEGASEGVGLGHYFLRHVERTRLFLIVVDASGSEDRDPYEEFKIVKNELKKYDKSLAKVPYIVVLNKCDLPSSTANIKKFKSKISKLKNPPKVFEISAQMHLGINELIEETAKQVYALPAPKPLEFEKFEFARPDPTSYEIVRDDDGAYVIIGGFVDELVRKVVLSDPQSFAYFQKLMREKGVIKELKRRGMKEGDTVRIADFDFEYIDN